MPVLGNGQADTGLVVFRLADREHALRVEHVGEVVPMVALAPVPEAPAWLEGVLNLRGRVVPVIDLRVRFGIARREPGPNTPIVMAAAGERMGGLIVDSVEDVLSVPSSAMSPPSPADPGPIAAVAVAGERLILVMNAEPLLAEAERFVPVEI